jgi:surface polysaccharide O-acyltransferase-like enzyme
MSFASAELAREAPNEPVAERVYYFDYIRMWATCGVVILHASALLLPQYTNPSVDFISKFTVANLGDAVGRFGVGCFFMVSGALLLSPQRGFRVGKGLRRIGIPLVTWSLIYLGFHAYLVRKHLPLLGGTVPKAHPVAIVRGLVTSPFAYHLWFLYALIGIYLVLPLLRPLTALPEQRRDQLVRYGLVLWGVFVVLVPTLRFLWPHLITVDPRLFPSVPAGYVGTALFGFYLHHHGVRVTRGVVFFVGALVGMSAASLLLFHLLTHGHAYGWTLGNLTPQITLYTACVFLLAKTSFNRPGGAYAFVALFSRLSFRIYLVHALVLHYLVVATPLSDWYQDAPLASIPTATVLTLAVSFAFAWLIDQITPIRDYI